MARLERFELPTFWFVGPFRRVRASINQSLAALANRRTTLS